MAIHSLLRRLPPGRSRPTPVEEGSAVAFGAFRLDPQRRAVFRGDDEVRLRPQAFDVLAYLAHNQGRVVSKEELLDRLWPDTAVTEDNLVQCVVDVRRALEDREQQFVRTVARRGYVFDPPKTAEALSAPPRRRFAIALSLLVVSIVAAAAGAYFFRRSRAAPAETTSLAVLPFRPVGSAAGEEHLDLGMADAIITRLASVPQIHVRPTATVRRFARGTALPAEAGRVLRVDHVVDGTVQHADGRVRVSVQLVRVHDDRTLWAETFDERRAGIFTMQDAISMRVADALAVRLTGEQRQRLGKRPTESFEAWELYLRGRYFFERRTPEDLRKAVTSFEEAVREDPRFALAWAWIAYALSPLMTFEHVSLAEGLPKMRVAAERAHQLDPELAEAHEAIAQLRSHEWDWEGEERAHRRALALRPSDPTAYLWYGFLLNALGRYEEGLQARQRAYELDPLNLTIGTALAGSLARTGRYEDAERQIRRTLELDPGFSHAREVLALTYWRQGRRADAVRELRAVATTRNGLFHLGQGSIPLISALAMTGRTDEARRLLAAVEKNGRISALERACIHASFGNPDEAFAWLERAYEARAPMMMTIGSDWRLEPLHSDPRFGELARRIGIRPSRDLTASAAR